MRRRTSGTVEEESRVACSWSRGSTPCIRRVVEGSHDPALFLPDESTRHAAFPNAAAPGTNVTRSAMVGGETHA